MGQCDILEGDCYYDGSGLQAGELAKEWASSGFDDEVIYQYLEAKYRHVFHDEYPQALDG